jgi:hypothetical protein
MSTADSPYSAASDRDLATASTEVPAQAPTHDNVRYDAFISYSRRNLEVADKIERDLETFPLPRHVRKRLGRRNLNVFRDISDMTGRLRPPRWCTSGSVRKVRRVVAD